MIQKIQYNNIKKVMVEKGLKQAWLCKKINRSFCQVNCYINNRNQPPIEILFKIADALNVNPSHLINDNYNKI